MRTGPEDFVCFVRNTLARSNSALVKRAAETLAKYERLVTTVGQAREILALN